MSARPNPHFAFPPYHVEVFPTGVACVCNKHGINVLTFIDMPERPGWTLTSPEEAEQICAAWNDADQS